MKRVKIKADHKVERWDHGRIHFAAVLLVLILAAVAGWLVVRKTTPETHVKNVLLISIDTCRADHLSCYGFNQPTTPNIDKLAAESIVFTHAISPVPITLPSHASMLTGTIPPYHGVHDNVDYHLPEADLTLAEILRDHGFTTAAIVSAFMLDSQFGLDQGFTHYDDTITTPARTLGINERRGGDTSRLALQWLDEHKTEDFFLFLHYFDPHSPYDPPPAFAARVGNNAYAGEIAYVDNCVGAVINKLKQLHLYDSTLIIVTSDHGEMLGEHGEESHAYFIYQSAIRVPLIIKMPGADQARIDKPVGLIDLVPTVLGALGIETPEHVQGEDLSANLSHTQEPEPRHLYCQSMVPSIYDAAALHGLVGDRWKYIHTARPELYDLTNDPHESDDLAARHPQRVAAYQQQLEDILQSSLRKDHAAGNIQLDAEAIARIKSLGYVGDKVSEDFQLDQSHHKADPKDLIDFHIAWKRAQSDRAPILLYAQSSTPSQKNYDKEIAICRDLIQLRPDFFAPHLCLGQIATLKGDLSAAVTHLTEALRLKPEQYDAHDLMGRALAKLGQADQAIHHLEQALKLKPDDPMAHNNLAMVLAQQGKLDRANEHFYQALAINPKLFQTHYNLGRTLFLQGKLDKSVAHCEASLRLNPNQGETLNLLAQVRATQGDTRGAAANLDAALKLKPNWPTALNNLAWLKTVSDDPQVRDPQAAIRLAQRACELTNFKRPSYLLTLASAYAGARKFTDAIRVSETALELVRAAGHQDQIAQIEKQIKFYRSQTSRPPTP